MNKEELIKLGEKILLSEGTEEEINNLIELFNQNVPHPDGANLFFYPESYNSRRDKISEYNTTVEEVVDKALGYNPITLLLPKNDDENKLLED